MKSFVQTFLRKISYYARYPSYCAQQVFSKRFSYIALKGRERNSGLAINMLYLGEGRSLEYLKTLFFSSITHEAVIDHYSLFDVMCGIGALPEGYDLRICEFMPRILKFIPKKSHFIIPEWIEQEISLVGSWEDVVGRFRKSTRSHELRFVRKYKYACDVVTDRTALKYFYDELYLPYASQRFQKAVEIVDDEWLITAAQNGGLLRILHKDHVIAGGVLCHEKQYLDWIWLGALMENGQDLYKGALSSLYYHSIKYAHDEGFPKIKIGTSRPFLTDGVYRFKRKWGAQCVRSRYNITSLLVDFNFHSRVCRQCMENYPFITEHDKRFYANFFVRDENTNEKQIIKRIEDLISPGLCGINVYSFGQLAALPASINMCPVYNIDLNNKLCADNNQARLIKN